MPLFVAQHRHPPEACPVSPQWSAQLLAHVSAATAARYRVAIQAEAVLDQEHGLILVVEAADREHVERFMAFFARFGSVQVLPASVSEAAVARGSCVVDTEARSQEQYVEESGLTRTVPAWLARQEHTGGAPD